MWVFGKMKCCLLFSSLAFSGPSLPNLSYSDKELFKPLYTFKEKGKGQNVVAMHKGYLFYVYGKDSGKSGGGFTFWDISNPRKPVRVYKEDVKDLRESHGMGFHSSDGKDYAALQGGNGVMVWDMTNVKSPRLVKYVKTPKTGFSDYDTGVWWVVWQAPYIYASGGFNGLHIVDASNPEDPRHVKTVPTKQLGNYRMGPLFVVGNLMMSSMVHWEKKVSGLSTIDISDPKNPVLLDVSRKHLPVYSSFLYGNQFYGGVLAKSGGKIVSFDVSNPRKIGAPKYTGSMSGGGEYLHAQDNYIHWGAGSTYHKVDIRTGKAVGKQVKIPGQEGFANPLGNLVLLTDDHYKGSALFPHQASPDKTPPEVNMHSPPDGAKEVALTSRIGFVFTDQIDVQSLSGDAVVVKPIGGLPVRGLYSSSNNTVNFAPIGGLKSNTTYEVIVPRGKIRDYAGNAVTKEFRSTFSTGKQLTVRRIDNVVDGDGFAGAGFPVPRFLFHFGGASPSHGNDLLGRSLYAIPGP